jgi:hypothetical protein
LTTERKHVLLARIRRLETLKVGRQAEDLSWWNPAGPRSCDSGCTGIIRAESGRGMVAVLTGVGTGKAATSAGRRFIEVESAR